MNTSPILLNAVLILGLFLMDSRPLSIQETGKGQDLTGGVGQFSIKRPKNPPVHRNRSQDKKAAETQPPSQVPKGALLGSIAGSGASVGGGKAASEEDAKTKPEYDDKTEDALFLGNASRDARPPRYEEAERAYKLASKLSPKDPRPYVGLGNIYYDQKRFAESANMYREALRLAALLTSEERAQLELEAIGANAAVGAIIGAIAGGGKGAAIGAVIGVADVTPSSSIHNWYAYLGNALLFEEKWAEAEVELRNAVAEREFDDQLHVLLGYALFKQQKFIEASAEYQKAVELDKKNKLYKNLLKESKRQEKKHR